MDDANWEDTEYSGSLSYWISLHGDPYHPVAACVWAALAVILAALSLWLAIRVYNRRERWAKWTLAIVVAFPALYILSFGIYIWMYSREYLPKWTDNAGECFCLPYCKIVAQGPDPASEAALWYWDLWRPAEQVYK